MSYYSAFKIEDTSDLRISKKLIKPLKKKIKKVKKRIKYIDNINDDSISGKEYKKLQKEKKELEKPIVISLSSTFKITNNLITFETYYSDKYKMLYFDGNSISFLLEEGGTFELFKEGKFYVGSGELYSSSNYDWTQEMFISFITEFNCSAILEDMGDEESGFVYQDGCDRKLARPEIYINGKRI